MFKLTDIELQNAFEAICHHGYSTMLPPPCEWDVVVNNWPKVKQYLTGIDIDTYTPYKSLQVFAPKNRAHLRVIHILHPEDLLIYTALILIIKNDFENKRISRKARRVFSYRTDTSVSNRLYNVRGAYDKYLLQLYKKSNKNSTKFVGIADIADFYPRIYQHRLENIVTSAASTQRGCDVARVLVKKLISNLMGKNSYGIPVGPYASRVLGEAVLIDVDSYLSSRHIDFVRWVDDYNIFVRSEHEAQSTLFTLAKWLYIHYGLTLQSSKTKILPVSQYQKKILSKPEENITDRDRVISLLCETVSNTGYDDEIEIEEPDDEQVQGLLEKLQGYDLLGILEESISNKELVDYEVVRYVLTRVPLIPGIDEELKSKILDIVLDNTLLFYPVAEYVAEYVLSFKVILPCNRKKIAQKLLKSLKSKRNPPPDYYVMWILYIFSTSHDWNHARNIIDIYQCTKSEVIKRYAALAIAKSGSRDEALVIKNDLPAASSLLRIAILSASNKLGIDEKKHWKYANKTNGILEKLI